MKAHTLYLRPLSGPSSCLLSSIIIHRTSFKKKVELPFIFKSILVWKINYMIRKPLFIYNGSPSLFNEFIVKTDCIICSIEFPAFWIWLIARSFCSPYSSIPTVFCILTLRDLNKLCV